MNIFKFTFIALFTLAISLSCTESKKQNSEKKLDNTENIISPNYENKQVEQWVSLFNGKNLDGWEVKSVKEDEHYNFWSVKDGAILVNSMGVKDHDYIWLQTEKEYSDFELKLKFQSYRESIGNSGVQIRSRYDRNSKAKGSKVAGWLDGPQIDIHTTDPWRNGLIYDETRGHQRWIYPDLPNWNIDKAIYAPKVIKHYYADESPHWNTLVIICKGNNITSIVNDIVVADYDGTGILDDSWHKKFGIDKKGFIALQLHKNNQLKIAFKDIKIKELNSYK